MTTEEMQNKIEKIFSERFGGEGNIYASAGRINLIGEHTDYNGGFVFPGAIDKVIMAEIRPNDMEKVRVFSIDIDEYAEFGLKEEDAPSQSWARYIFGICREIQKRGGSVKGFDAVFAGNVPLGAGLSSSAALESCFAFALNDLFNGNSIDKFELAKIGQSTEHNYCGVNCGIMDQFASVFGKEGHLMRLDCRSLEHEYYPFNPEGYRLVLVDSRVKHELKDSPTTNAVSLASAWQNASELRLSATPTWICSTPSRATSLLKTTSAQNSSSRRKSAYLQCATLSLPVTMRL